MNGHVFQCHGETTDKKQFLKTVQMLADHVNKTFDYPQDVISMCKPPYSLQAISLPREPTEAEMQVASKRFIWESEMKMYMNRKLKQESNRLALFSVIWGQCSPLMQAKLESLTMYQERRDGTDCRWLINEIQGITHRFEGTRYVYLSLDDAWTEYYNMRQGGNQTLHEYLEDFRARIEVLEHYGASIGADQAFIDEVKARRQGGAATDEESSLNILRRAATDEESSLNILRRGMRPDVNLRGTISEAAIKEEAKQRCMAIAFLKRADQRQYGSLWSDLENQFSRGFDQYPTDLTAAYNLLLTYRAPTQVAAPRPNGGSDLAGITFVQNSDDVPGSDGVVHVGIKCFNCQSFGHYATKCTEASTRGSQFLHYTFANEPHGSIPNTWILLDNQSTCSVFNNPDLLSDIRYSDVSLRVHTNGGIQVSNMIGTLKNFGEVWYNPNSLANIISMASVCRLCRVTMDSSKENCINVYRQDGSIMKFQQYENGLYFYDTRIQPYSPEVSDYVFLNTVRENKANYTSRELKGADQARKLYRMLNHPSEEDFAYYLDNNLVLNCPLTSDDAKRALAIYGPEVSTLKGKTTKKQNKGIPNFNPVKIPAPIIAKYNKLRLFIDVFFVNGMPFFHTISQFVKFRTVAALRNRTKDTLFKELEAVLNLYKARGFDIIRVEGDREFACLKNDFQPIDVNIADADDHVHEAERSVRTLKERTRCSVHTLPYKRIPRTVVKSIVETACRALNQFPAKDGASKHLSPLTIMTGLGNLDYNDLSIELGSYAQVYEDNNPKNTTKNRTTPAIALNRTGNAQGGYYFLSLVTGKRLSRGQWDELPIPDGVIAAVEQMALNEGQPLIENNGLVFEWSPGVIIGEEQAHEGQGPEYDYDDSDDEYDFVPDSQEDEDLVEEMEDYPVHGEDADGVHDQGVAEFAQEPELELGYLEDDEEPPLLMRGEEYDSDSEDEDDDDELPLPDYGPNPDLTENEERVPDLPGNEERDRSDTPSGESARVPRYHLRANRTRSYDHRYDRSFLQTDYLKSKGISTSDSVHNVDVSKISLHEAVDQAVQGASFAMLHQYVTHFIMTQMSMKAGVKKFGHLAVEALYKEFLQLHNKTVFEGQRADDLSKETKKAALRAINLIKEKRDGRIKGRTVADGSVQRELFTKDETTSPTVSTDALLMSLIIDGFEKRDVATADVEGAYLHADNEDYTLLRLENESVDIMCSVWEGYREFVTTEGGKKVLYLRLVKALYGCVKSALLWYELFTGTLKDMGFELNPYDMCVANKEVDGKQCTVAWYVDDNKISHVDPLVVTAVIEKIEARFGKMTVTRGKEHVFLGMKITFRDDGYVEIDMSDYCGEAIDDFGEVSTTEVSSPATRKLYDVDEDAKPLDRKRMEVFHSVVAKCLYISHRGRPDIMLPVAFLCTRVSRSTKEDWDKLKRVLQFVQSTINEPRILGAVDLKKMGTFADVAYAVHQDRKSHTGGALSFGVGTLSNKSRKQSLNTKSSTEAEVVGASDYLPNSIWMKKFMYAQGYELEENVFHQDNESAIRFAKNGRKSAGQNSKHIDIRYFFIKDRLELEDYEVRYCPTHLMIADFFTKPLQGNLFRKLRAVVMGAITVEELFAEWKNESPPVSTKERVGKDSFSNKCETETEGRSTDSSPSRPSILKKKVEKLRTYADVVKCVKRVRFGNERRKTMQTSPPLTLKK